MQCLVRMPPTTYLARSVLGTSPDSLQAVIQAMVSSPVEYQLTSLPVASSRVWLPDRFQTPPPPPPPPRIPIPGVCHGANSLERSDGNTYHGIPRHDRAQSMQRGAGLYDGSLFVGCHPSSHISNILFYRNGVSR